MEHLINKNSISVSWWFLLKFVFKMFALAMASVSWGLHFVKRIKSPQRLPFLKISQMHDHYWVNFLYILLYFFSQLNPIVSKFNSLKAKRSLKHQMEMIWIKWCMWNEMICFAICFEYFLCYVKMICRRCFGRRRQHHYR